MLDDQRGKEATSQSGPAFPAHFQTALQVGVSLAQTLNTPGTLGKSQLFSLVFSSVTFHKAKIHKFSDSIVVSLFRETKREKMSTKPSTSPNFPSPGLAQLDFSTGKPCVGNPQCSPLSLKCCPPPHHHWTSDTLFLKCVWEWLSTVGWPSSGGCLVKLRAVRASLVSVRNAWR